MTIKETSGKILLYFYQLQRTVPLSMENRQLGFINKKNGGVSLTSDKKWLTNNLATINPNSTDIFNAFMFLLHKGFIKSRERATKEARIYIGFQLTGKGIDLVEGVEQGDEGKRTFNTTFNIRVDDSMNVETLIRENLSKLLDS